MSHLQWLISSLYLSLYIPVSVTPTSCRRPFYVSGRRFLAHLPFSCLYFTASTANTSRSLLFPSTATSILTIVLLVITRLLSFFTTTTTTCLWETERKDWEVTTSHESLRGINARKSLHSQTLLILKSLLFCHFCVNKESISKLVIHVSLLSHCTSPFTSKCLSIISTGNEVVFRGTSFCSVTFPANKKYSFSSCHLWLKCKCLLPLFYSFFYVCEIYCDSCTVRFSLDLLSRLWGCLWLCIHKWWVHSHRQLHKFLFSVVVVSPRNGS